VTVALGERIESLGRRFARLATRAVVARPGLWRLFRAPLRAQFDRLAPVWHERRGPEAMAPLAAALDRLDAPPRSVLDLGTGTGKGAFLVAERFPESKVVGVDLSPRMVEEARGRLSAELAGRVRFEVADAAALPFADGAFDLVVLLNMIPFFDELARVTAQDGTIAVVSFSGPSTPIYTPWAKLRERLAERGFERFDELRAGTGDAFLARRSKGG
jgi:ubiquinone/menaquinone biosynthesis C-methylase UbiE